MAGLSSLHVLVLAARDRGRPEEPAAVAALADHTQRWEAAGHRVTVVTGARRLFRMRAAWATWCGAGRDADVVLEVVDATPYLTPFWGWLSAPRVLVVDALRGGRGVRALLAERIALGLLYRGTPVLAATPETGASLAALGVPQEAIHVADPGSPAAIAVLERTAEGSRVRLRDALSQSETAKAGGLAAATLANNVIQLLFTVVFTRLLGATGYGGLAALVSAFLILLVAGSAVQVAAAREAALGRLGEGEQLAATLAGWGRTLVIALVALTAASVLVRHPLGDLMGVPEHPWAAAAIVPTGVLWMGISLQRGVLQGLHAYGAVGSSIIAEGCGRLLFGLVLVGAGAGVTGAYLGTPLALAAVSAWLLVVLRRRTGTAHGAHVGYRLSRLVAGNWGPLLGLTLLAVLQNIDVIVVKHQLGGDRAGSYAAAAVAAKAVVWVAIGIGLHLLPEATRRAAAGLDPRPVLLRALGIVTIVAAPALAIFALIPHLLLKVAFGGERLTLASSSLVVLGAAMTLLAIGYLTVQYMIALGRRSFLWVLGTVAVAEPILLTARDYSLLSFATIVLVLQCVAAAGVLTLGLRARPPEALPAR